MEFYIWAALTTPGAGVAAVAFASVVAIAIAAWFIR
jgi:hypothetical protein